MKKWYVITHKRPHLDEIVAMFILERYGLIKYPNLEKSNHVIFWDAGTSTVDGRPASAWMKDGYIPVGVGGSIYDEHARSDKSREEWMCAALLVARDLHVEDLTELRRVLTYVIVNDASGQDVPNGLAGIINMLYAAGVADLEVIRWAHTFLKAKIIDDCRREQADKSDFVDFSFDGMLETMLRTKVDKVELEAWKRVYMEAKGKQQAIFHGETASAFQAQAKKELIIAPNGEQIALISIESDQNMLSSYAFSKFAGDKRADIFVQRRSSGHIIILINKRLNMRMSEVAKCIRRFELWKRGQKTIIEPKALECEGVLPEVPEWYYAGDRGEFILNGSKTATDIAATKLNLEEVRAIIKLALDPTNFPSQQADRCREGVCTASASKPCQYQPLTLSRCEQIKIYGQNARVVQLNRAKR